MKNTKHHLILLGLITLSSSNAIAEIKPKQLGSGWMSLTEQSDPFNSSIVKIIQISKGGFTFRCGELNMKVASYGYESLSFSAELKYLIDSNAVVTKTGKYSTYLGGSDLVTDSRYYSFKMSAEDVSAIKNGSSMKIAAKYGGGGWENKNINLVGFTSAYSMMCDQ